MLGCLGEMLAHGCLTNILVSIDSSHSFNMGSVLFNSKSRLYLFFQHRNCLWPVMSLLFRFFLSTPTKVRFPNGTWHQWRTSRILTLTHFSFTLACKYKKDIFQKSAEKLSESLKMFYFDIEK